MTWISSVFAPNHEYQTAETMGITLRFTEGMAQPAQLWIFAAPNGSSSKYSRGVLSSALGQRGLGLARPKSNLGLWLQT